jgi:hypothetical protein
LTLLSHTQLLAQWEPLDEEFEVDDAPAKAEDAFD